MSVYRRPTPKESYEGECSVSLGDPHSRVLAPSRNRSFAKRTTKDEWSESCFIFVLMVGYVLGVTGITMMFLYYLGLVPSPFELSNEIYHNLLT